MATSTNGILYRYSRDGRVLHLGSHLSCAGTPASHDRLWPWNDPRRNGLQRRHMFLDTDITKVVIEDRVMLPPDSSYLLAYLAGLTEIEGLANLDTSNVTNMSGMFCLCKSLASLDLSGWDTSNVTDTQHMFDGCPAVILSEKCQGKAVGKV